MNYRLLAVKGWVLLSMLISSVPLKAVVVACGVSELPKNNRLIVLHDCHASNDPRDIQQLDQTYSSLRDRLNTTQRPLYVLTETGPHWVKMSNGHSVMASLRETIETMTLMDEAIGTVVYAEDVEIRKLLTVTSSILRGKEKGSYDESRVFFWETGVKTEQWVQGEITFNDLLKDFEVQKERAAESFKFILGLCENEREQKHLTFCYNRNIEKAEQEFAHYKSFLQEVGVEDSSSKIYKTTYDWEKIQRAKMDRHLLNWYNPFFDFNAIARIFALQKQQSSIDIVFIAGDKHSWAIRHAFLDIRGIGDDYMKTYDPSLPLEEQQLSGELIYQLFQEKTPVRPVVGWDIEGYLVYGLSLIAAGVAQVTERMKIF